MGCSTAHPSKRPNRAANTRLEWHRRASAQTLALALGKLDPAVSDLVTSNVVTLARINGVPEGQHFGKTLIDLLGDLERQVSPLVRQVLASGRPLLHCDLSGILSARGEKGYWVGHYFPLKDSSGRTLQVVVVVLDVTPQGRLERFLAPLSTY
jgi:hypothetical protein